jgi:hypothetical protein
VAATVASRSDVCGIEYLYERRYIYVFSLFVLSCLDRGLATGRSPIQGALPNVYKQDSEKLEALDCNESDSAFLHEEIANSLLERARYSNFNTCIQVKAIIIISVTSLIVVNNSA